ncbi:MAG: Gfo/Idh/MocA family oxidoreductase [Planctomycetes bacterium]|nr:Gfo/Idh/MocA family oxidoreductase [Planctomycetota bacterium]
MKKDRMDNINSSTANRHGHDNGRMSRRTLLQRTAAAAAFTIVPRHVLGAPNHIPPSEKTTVAGIGVGGQGTQNMLRFQEFSEVQVVAVCDVHRESGGFLSWNWTQGKEQRLAGREPMRRAIDERYAEQKRSGTYRGCKAYSDYRELLAKEDVDAVMVATPDHSHALITMAALKKGKHVYCEKPLTYSVHEARLVSETAHQTKVATQLGNQGQASEEARLVAEFILDGAIGPVHEVHVTVGPPFWERPQWEGQPPETPAVPDGLDWDLWLGPAPVRPYHPAYHPWRWRDWRDFGTGPLGDMGCHVLSSVFKALKLTYPVSVEATCTELGPQIYPRRFEVRYEFPARDGMPPVAVTWHGGGLTPPRPKDLEPGRSVSGDLYIGEKGTLMGHRLIPESKMQRYGRPPQVLPRSPGHDKEWIDACRGGSPAGSDFVHHAGLLSETALLGNIAMRIGKKLTWDGPNRKFTNDDTANQCLHRHYREGWSL